jgi:polar amino acid transport system permease protein
VTGGENQPGSSAVVGERMDRLALASARVPFRLKTAAVWAVIFVILALFFAVANFDLEWMRDQLSFILGGVRYTIQIAVMGIALAVVLAGFGALARLSANPVAYGVSGFYVSFFRGTPLIVQMFLIYLALPQVGINLEAKFPGMPDWSSHIYTLGTATAGTIALGLNYGAYMTEIFRAGIQSVSHGQSEAAEALGMTYWQKMRKVILPQAFRVIIPPTGNDFISMLKDTALVSFLGSTVASAEIFRRANLVGSAASRNLEALIVAAAIYWALTAIFTFFQSRLERRVSRGYVRMAPLRTRQQPVAPAAEEEVPRDVG